MGQGHRQAPWSRLLWGGRVRKPPEPAGGSERRFLPRTVSTDTGGSDGAGDTGWGTWRRGLCHAAPRHLCPAQPHSPQAMPGAEGNGHGHYRCHGCHHSSPPALAQAHSERPRVRGRSSMCPPLCPCVSCSPRVPSSPIFCVKILSNVTSPRSSRYFCMTLRMLGGHQRGSAHRPAPCPLADLCSRHPQCPPCPPCVHHAPPLVHPQAPLVCMSSHLVCPPPSSVTRCWALIRVRHGVPHALGSKGGWEGGYPQKSLPGCTACHAAVCHAMLCAVCHAVRVCARRVCKGKLWSGLCGQEGVCA